MNVEQATCPSREAEFRASTPAPRAKSPQIDEGDVEDQLHSAAMTPEVLRQLAEEWIPFNKFVGVRALRVEKGDILFEVAYRDELIGDPVKKALHGGVISMLADTAGGMAVWSELPDPRSRVSTIDLRIDYLLPGRQEDLRAHATSVRVGKTVGVADVRLFHPSAESATIATGKGVYAIRVVKDHLSGG